MLCDGVAACHRYGVCTVRCVECDCTVCTIRCVECDCMVSVLFAVLSVTVWCVHCSVC